MLGDTFIVLLLLGRDLEAIERELSLDFSVDLEAGRLGERGPKLLIRG